MQSLVASLVPSVAGLTVRRRNTSAKAPAGRRASLRVVAHGGVGGSGGPQYPGKDKPHGSDQAPWRKKLILDDPDQADPENAGRGQRWTPPPTPAPAAAAPAPSNDSWGSPAAAAPPPPPPPPAPSSFGGAAKPTRRVIVDDDNIDPDFRPGRPDNYTPGGISATHGGSALPAAGAAAPPPPPPPPPPAPSSYGAAKPTRRVIVDEDNIDPDFRPGRPDNYTPGGISATHGGAHAGQ